MRDVSSGKEIEEADVLLVHTAEHVKALKESSEACKDLEMRFLDEAKEAPTNKHTDLASRLCAEGVVHITRQVLQGELDNGFAIVRPPGHHAYKEQFGGFCFFNNVAIAAEVARKEFGLKKIAIFDWDIHHGDGTQEFFYESDEVLYVSLHRYDNNTFYPNKEFAQAHFVGKGKGEGFNVNVAWETGKVVIESKRRANEVVPVGNNEYRLACEEVLFPVLREFEPELILISCGFDSAIHDWLGWCRVSPSQYHWMTAELLKIQPKTVVALEGGYNVEYLGQHAEGVCRALLGQQMNRDLSADRDAGFYEEGVDGAKAVEYAKDNIQATRKALEPFWKCLQK